MKKELKQIEKFLNDNGITFDNWNFGGDYFGPLYTWPAIVVSFDYYDIANTPGVKEKYEIFKKFIKRNHKNITVKNTWAGAYDRYDIFYTPDYNDYEKYIAARDTACEQYWDKVHAARLAAATKVA